MNNDELMHYGVKGMKWGRRKSSYSNAGAAIKRLTDPTTLIKKDGYQKSRNPIATTISKDGYKKQKKPSGTRSYKAEKTAVSSIRSNLNSTKAQYKSARKAYNKSLSDAYNHGYQAYSPFKKRRQANADRWERVNADSEKVVTSKKAYKKAKTERKNALNKTYKEINKKTSFGEKLLANSVTRKKAAKYVVDNDMSMKEARKKANKQALRNTAALIGAYGGITVAALYKMNH